MKQFIINQLQGGYVISIMDNGEQIAQKIKFDLPACFDECWNFFEPPQKIQAGQIWPQGHDNIKVKKINNIAFDVEGLVKVPQQPEANDPPF